MQIRNNWGEVIGEINSGFTDKGELIRSTIAAILLFKTSASATIKGKFAQRM
jgi:hypothetical protein